MSPKTALSIVASLGLAAMSPVAAVASQTAFGSAPVSVSACSTETTTDSSASTYETPRLTTNLRYRFVNNAGVAARAVTFDIAFDGESSQIVDRGTFAPGVGIDRETGQYANAAVSGPVACRVTRVDFRDGTSWHADGATTVSAR